MSTLSEDNLESFQAALSVVYAGEYTFQKAKQSVDKDGATHYVFDSNRVARDEDLAMTGAEYRDAQNATAKLELIETKQGAFILKETINGTDGKPIKDYDNRTIGVFTNSTQLENAIQANLDPYESNVAAIRNQDSDKARVSNADGKTEILDLNATKGPGAAIDGLAKPASEVQR